MTHRTAYTNHPANTGSAGRLPRKGPVAEERRDLVRRLLRERVSLRGVARATGLSRSWVQAFANALYREGTPHDPGALKKTRPARS